MRVPKVKKRRIYDLKTYGRDMLEGDRDFVANNIQACVWFLEHRDEINALLKGQK